MAWRRELSVGGTREEAVWRPLRKAQDLDRLWSFYYTATVLNDNTVRTCGVIIDIPPGPRKRSYAKARVEVRQLLDGSWRIYHRDRWIATHASTSDTELRANPRRNRPAASKAFRHAINQVAPSLP